MNNPVISVIVPFYKAETTLERCVESILNQSYPNLELLLIDDGSTDGSGEICRQFVERDRRVRYHYQENGGVSSARNLGIDLARGEYVCFVDSDDWMEQDALKLLSEAAEQYKADCVIPRMKGVYYSANGEYLKDVFHKDAFTQVIHSDELPKEFERLFRSWSCFSSCGRLYRTEWLAKNEIRFDPSICVLEDFCFNLVAFEEVDTIVHVDVIAYDYAVHGIENYQFKRDYRATMDGTKAAYNRLLPFLMQRNMPFSEAYANLLISYWIQTIRVVQETDLRQGERIKVLKEIAKEVKSERLMEYCNPAAVDTQYKVLFHSESLALYSVIVQLKKIKRKTKELFRENH